MRKKYDWTKEATREWIEKVVIEGIKGNNLRAVFLGADNAYIIQERDTEIKTLTDMHYLIISGLYPVYMKYNLGGGDIVRSILEEMIDSGNPYELFQVYDYVKEESKLRDDYYGLPYITVDKTLIYNMKKKRKEMEKELKEANKLDGYNAWEITGNIEKNCDEFQDPEACFCAEYNNGGKKGYVYLKQDNDGRIKKVIEECLENGNLVDVIWGEKAEYRIEKTNYRLTGYTNTKLLIEEGFFPLFKSGNIELEDKVRTVLLQMVESDNPTVFYQAYEYACNETKLMEKYCNLPFYVMNKELIKKMKKRRLEMEASLKETPIRKLTAWEITGNMERNYDAFSKTEEFFKEYF